MTQITGLIFTHLLQFWLGAIPLLLGLWIIKRYIFD